MPDWFYRTVSQRVLFRCSAELARDVAVKIMGTIARVPGGAWLIDQLGHMRPHEKLGAKFLGTNLCSRIGLGPWVDGRAAALPAWTRFGFGYLEVGPISRESSDAKEQIKLSRKQEALVVPIDWWELDLPTAIAKLNELQEYNQPVIARIRANGELNQAATLGEVLDICRELAPFVMAVSLDVDSGNYYDEKLTPFVASFGNAFKAVERQNGKALPWLLVVPSGGESFVALPAVEAALNSGCAGIILEARTRNDGSFKLGRDSYANTLNAVQICRDKFGSEFVLIAASGIHSPRQALELLSNGADFLQIDTGLIFTGPGLTKRINGAVYSHISNNPELGCESTSSAQSASTPKLAKQSWFWQLLLGLGMLFGSFLALLIALTRVVLPYDETFVNMTAAQLENINPRLLHFLTHDRVSLAGVMLSVGVLFTGLAWFGTRRGKHWAQQTIIVAATIGFASFFLFLAYGYLDPFHAFVTAIMSQFMLLSLITDNAPMQPDSPCLDNDWPWRWSLWGQLLAIVHSLMLMLGGIIFIAMGSTTVFVAEDLEFIGTTAEELSAASSKLIPLVAHDRATLGGMLIVNGFCFLLPALWGITRNSRWLWATTTIAGLCGYLPALFIHYHVGYTNLWHLTPAYLGLNIFVIVQALLFPYQWGAKNPATKL